MDLCSAVLRLRSQEPPTSARQGIILDHSIGSIRLVRKWLRTDKLTPTWANEEGGGFSRGASGKDILTPKGDEGEVGVDIPAIFSSLAEKQAWDETIWVSSLVREHRCVSLAENVVMKQ